MKNEFMVGFYYGFSVGALLVFIAMLLGGWQ